VRIYIHSMDAPIEIGEDQRIADWKRVRKYLSSQSERIVKLGAMVGERLPPMRKDTVPEARPMLPSICDLVAAAPATRFWPLPHLAADHPAPFPVVVTDFGAFRDAAGESSTNAGNNTGID
jgi:hypothetical protein